MEGMATKGRAQAYFLLFALSPVYFVTDFTAVIGDCANIDALALWLYTRFSANLYQTVLCSEKCNFCLDDYVPFYTGFHPGPYGSRYNVTMCIFQFPGFNDAGLAYIRELNHTFPHLFAFWDTIFHAGLQLKHPDYIKMVLKRSGSRQTLSFQLVEALCNAYSS